MIWQINWRDETIKFKWLSVKMDQKFKDIITREAARLCAEDNHVKKQIDQIVDEICKTTQNTTQTD